jgi:hypothetical protein
MSNKMTDETPCCDYCFTEMKIGNAVLDAKDQLMEGAELSPKDEETLVLFYKLALMGIIAKKKLQLYCYGQAGRSIYKLYDVVTVSDEALAFYVIKMYAEKAQAKIYEDMKVEHGYESGDDDGLDDMEKRVCSQEGMSRKAVSPSDAECSVETTVQEREDEILSEENNSMKESVKRERRVTGNGRDLMVKVIGDLLLRSL